LRITTLRRTAYAILSGTLRAFHLQRDMCFRRTSLLFGAQRKGTQNCAMPWSGHQITTLTFENTYLSGDGKHEGFLRVSLKLGLGLSLSDEMADSAEAGKISCSHLAEQALSQLPVCGQPCPNQGPLYAERSQIWPGFARPIACCGHLSTQNTLIAAIFGCIPPLESSL
jgi:hypothetical protein